MNDKDEIYMLTGIAQDRFAFKFVCMKVELSHHDLVARFIFPLIVRVRI